MITIGIMKHVPISIIKKVVKRMKTLGTNVELQEIKFHTVEKLLNSHRSIRKFKSQSVCDDLDLKGKFKSEIKSLKETTNVIEKEVKDLKNLENEINSTKEKSTLVEKDVHDKNKNKTQDEADLI